MSQKIIVETDRLVLRELQISDAADCFQLNSNPEVIKYTGDVAFKSVEEAETFLKNYKAYEKTGYGRWAVIEKSSNKFIGFCGLKLDEENLIDIGFRFLQESWGKGYATESSIAAMLYGFENFQMDEIIGRADTQNKASIRVLEKLGMTFWKIGETDALGSTAYYRISKNDFLNKFQDQPLNN